MARNLPANIANDDNDDNTIEITPTTSRMPARFFEEEEDEVTTLQKRTNRAGKMTRAELGARAEHQAFAQLNAELKKSKRDENWETTLAVFHTGLSAAAPSAIKYGSLEGVQHLTHGTYQPPIMAVNGATLVLVFMASTMLVRERSHALVGLALGTIYAITGR